MGIRVAVLACPNAIADSLAHDAHSQASLAVLDGAPVSDRSMHNDSAAADMESANAVRPKEAKKGYTPSLTALL
jgi:hypothetical protein